MVMNKNNNITTIKLLKHQQSITNSNTQTLITNVIKDPYLTSLPYKQTQRVTNVEDFSLIYHKMETTLADSSKDKDKGKSPIRKINTNPISQFELNRLILIHKAKKKKKLFFDTDLLDRHSLINKRELNKISINADKSMSKESLLLPSLNSFNSLQSLNSQRNIFKTPTLESISSSKEKIVNDYKTMNERMKKEVMRRSPGKGICVKIGVYKKNKPKQSKSLFDILNDKDYISKIIEEQRKLFKRESLILTSNYVYDKNNDNSEYDISNRLIVSNPKLNHNKKVKITLNKKKASNNIDKEHCNSNSNNERITARDFLERYCLPRSKSIITNSITKSKPPHIHNSDLLVNKKQDFDVKQALHMAQLDHLKDIIDPKTMFK